MLRSSREPVNTFNFLTRSGMMSDMEFSSPSLSRVIWKARGDYSMHRKTALTLMTMRETKSRSPKLVD
jgi:hypothetical protein